METEIDRTRNKVVESQNRDARFEVRKHKL